MITDGAMENPSDTGTEETEGAEYIQIEQMMTEGDSVSSDGSYLVNFSFNFIRERRLK